MKHLASDSFWQGYGKLPPDVREIAGKNFALLKSDSRHSARNIARWPRERAMISAGTGSGRTTSTIA
jgi:hypothetical protein